MNNGNSLIAFEQPLNERMRTFLRLEHLFQEMEHHCADETPHGRSAGLRTLLDILSILGRSDQRTELLKELEMHDGTLSELHNRPGVNASRLEDILDQIRQHIDDIESQPPHAALFVRDHEFLGSVVSRSAIAGGTCGFDLPGYHRWLQLSPAQQIEDLRHWSECTFPYRDAITLLVDLIRESADAKPVTAENGVYVHVIQNPAHLVRVLLPAGSTLYPEISAGKHRCTVRFLEQPDVNQRATPVQEDVDFHFARCAL